MALTLLLVFVIGLCVGSLLNLVVVRLPREGAFGGWPRCTRCGRPLAWWQMLPLVGWLAQRGRGRCCGRPLGWIFPLVELTSGVSLALLYARYGLGAPFFYLAFVAAVLIVTGAIDWLHRFIYTFVILGAALVAVIGAPFVPHHSLLNALLGALVAGFVFAIFFALARAMYPGRSAPFGLGDVYLAIFIGAAVGIVNLMPAIFIGMLLAGLFSAALLLMRRAGWPGVPEYISYGTFLCIGALGYLLARGL
ncbi:MAG: prepilin peptidase [Chloroflexota bacterium]|nr:MAG: prepilin peptidase [Chloroflexota bacterium]